MGKNQNRERMATIVLLRGLPASGKSSWAVELLKKEPSRWLRINKDGLRRMLIGETWDANVEDVVHSLSEQAMKTALKSGFDVIIDNTHLTPKSVNKIHKIAAEIGNVLVNEKVFPVSVEECLRRNALREGVARVPDKVIHDMARGAGIDKHDYRNMKDVQKYYEPHAFRDPPKIDPSLKDAILCDLDGTLALIDGRRNPYDASNCDVVDDPNIPVIACVRAMWEKGTKIIFMSGRDSKYREQTIRFIEKHCPWLESRANDYSGSKTLAYSLHMRIEDDSRKDSIIKRELYDAHVNGRYNVVFVLDDRDQVVSLWRHELGLTCFQVQEGSF